MTTMKVIGTPLYQWETGRQLQIIPLQNMTVSAVHFSNPGDLEALVVKPKEVDGKLVADIPNILLQKGSNIVAYSVNVSSGCVETLRDCILPVRKRAKPSDYVYTETEVLSYSYLDKRLDDLEGEGLAKVVTEYLKENPVQAGATKEEAEQIAKNKEDIADLQKDKLNASELPTAINKALEQAKASGEFNGKDGEDGKDGKDGKSAYEYAQDAGYTRSESAFAAKLAEEPLRGFTSEITPQQVYDAVIAGRNVVLIYADDDADEAIFTGFVPIVSAGIVTSSGIISEGDTAGYLNLIGIADSGKWHFNYNMLPSADSIPEIPDALPNPNALTFTGAATGTYDGSSAVTIDIPVSGGSVDLGVTGATVGQTVKIASVDGNGVPTAWLPTDFPSGGGSGGEWVQIANVTTEEAVTKIHVSEGIPEWANGLFFHIEAKFEASSSYNYLQPLINNEGFLNGNLNLGSGIQNYNIICEIHNDGTTHSLHGVANVKTQDAQITHGRASLPLKSIGVQHADVYHGDSMLSAGTIFQVWARVGA